MSKFLKLLVLFSLPVFVGIISLEYILREIPNDYSYKRSYLDRSADDLEVLFLGSSHIYYGVNPEYISYKSFNASHISQSLDLDLLILEKYKNNWEHLKYIVIPVDYLSLYTTLANSVESWRYKNYSIYYDIPTDQVFWDRFEIFSNKLPYNVARAKSFFANGSGDITCNRWGFGTGYKAGLGNDLNATGYAAAKRHTGNTNDRTLFSYNVKVINSMIDFAEERRIKIVFITTPAYESYTRNLDSKQINNTVNTIRKITEGRRNLSYYNFLTDQTFTEKDFFDADHLNQLGSKKFTIKLDNIIRNLDEKDN